MTNLGRISRTEVANQSVDLLPARGVGVGEHHQHHRDQPGHRGERGHYRLDRERSGTAACGCVPALAAFAHGEGGGSRLPLWSKATTMTANELVDRTTAGPVQGGPRPSRAVGLRLLGPYEGSGFREERYLVERADRQMVLLTKLLYLIVDHADGRTSTDLLADRVSRAYGQRLDPTDLVQLIHDKLGPSGLVALWNGAPVGQRRADPLLALSVRGVLLPTAAVRVVARVFAPFFHRPVVLGVLTAVVAFDVWMVSNLAPSEVFAALIEPAGVLAVLALLLAATIFHEFGHAAGCSYGGAKPGRIGVGIYLWIPAFYTNVTNAYRLDRAGRLRTDLGGVYFNAVFIVAAAATYLWTGWAPLLAVVALSHLEIVQQLLPVVRFDGYYILGDLAGVPNLFGHVRPIMRSLLPSHRGDRSVVQLQLRSRVIVTAWVLVTVPALIIGFGLAAWNAPATWPASGTGRASWRPVRERSSPQGSRARRRSPSCLCWRSPCPSSASAWYSADRCCTSTGCCGPDMLQARLHGPLPSRHRQRTSIGRRRERNP